MRATRSSPYRDRNDRWESIFVHVPRTAGTSIANALFEDGDCGHTPLYAYRAFDEARYRNYFKFAFVRNPFSRLVSAFHQNRENARNPRKKPWAAQYFSDLDGFIEFVERMGGNSSYRRVVMAHDHFRPQWEFVTVGGRVDLDFLGKFEDLEKDFQRISEELGANTSLPKKNSSSHANYEHYYTSKAKNIVEKLYKNDFRKLGYN